MLPFYLELLTLYLECMGRLSEFTFEDINVFYNVLSKLLFTNFIFYRPLFCQIRRLRLYPAGGRIERVRLSQTKRQRQKVRQALYHERIHGALCLLEPDPKAKDLQLRARCNQNSSLHGRIRPEIQRQHAKPQRRIPFAILLEFDRASHP